MTENALLFGNHATSQYKESLYASTGASLNVNSISEYIAAYTYLSERKNIFVIDNLVKDLENAISFKEPPKGLYVSGNREREYFRIASGIPLRLLTDDHVDAIIQPMLKFRFIKELDLSYNNIEDRGAATIAAFLQDDNSLSTLNLHSNNIRSQGAISLARALVINEFLVNFNIGYNQIGDEGGLEIASMLQINTSLTHLDISSCSLGATSIIALATVLQNNDSLGYLNISNNMSRRNRLTQSLENDVMIHVSKMMRYNRTLNDLNLSRMGINDFCVVNYLSGAIGSNIHLQSLNLSCNKITRDGGVALCLALSDNAQLNLKYLNLSCCSIQDEGAEAVGAMLTKNTTLKSLNLDGNSITGVGLKKIADGVGRNRSLTHITLWDNDWDISSCESFSKLISGTVKNIISLPPTQENHSLEEKDSDILTGMKNRPTSMMGNNRTSTSNHRPSISSIPLKKPFLQKNIDFVIYCVDGIFQVARNTDFQPISKE